MDSKPFDNQVESIELKCNSAKYGSYGIFVLICGIAIMSKYTSSLDLPQHLGNISMKTLCHFVENTYLN
jgi:hypothetical protein